MEDYSNILILKSLGFKSNMYQRVYYYIAKKKIEKIKTSQGIGVDKNKLKQLLETENRGRRKTKNLTGYQIDLSTNSKINCLYRRLVDMSKSNKDCCQRDNRLPRYVDQNGYMCINLKDYIKPQIKVLAKKLEVKQHEIVSAIFELLHKKYLEIKHENEKENNDNADIRTNDQQNLQ